MTMIVAVTVAVAVTVCDCDHGTYTHTHTLSTASVHFLQVLSALQVCLKRQHRLDEALVVQQKQQKLQRQQMEQQLQDVYNAAARRKMEATRTATGMPLSCSRYTSGGPMFLV